MLFVCRLLILVSETISRSQHACSCVVCECVPSTSAFAACDDASIKTAAVFGCVCNRLTSRQCPMHSCVSVAFDFYAYAHLCSAFWWFGHNPLGQLSLFVTLAGGCCHTLCLMLLQRTSGLGCAYRRDWTSQAARAMH